jgi:hypothetical protein
MADMADFKKRFAASEQERRHPPNLFDKMKAGMDNPDAFQATGEVSNYSPSWRDRLADAMGTVASKISGKDYNEARRDSMTLMGLSPGVGTAMAAEDAGTAARQGDWKGAALAGLGAIPEVGPELRALGTAEKGGRKVLAEAMGPAATKAGKREAIGATSLREKPLDEAIDIAKSGRHIIPSPKGGETTFVGAPYQVKGPEDIHRLRGDFDRMVGLGGAGADWYVRAQNWIKKVAGPDPASQHELARNLGLFSPQADPNSNLGASVKARNHAIMGMEPEGGVVRTTRQWNDYKREYQTGAEKYMGDKVDPFAKHLDPTQVSPTTGVNDTWHARNLGYSEPEVKTIGPQKHAWMDAETVHATSRANEAATAGRTDWTPGEVQAAPWVYSKAQGIENRWKWPPDKAMAEAHKSYPEYAGNYTASGTHEMTPGRQTDHLPGIANGDQQARDDFAKGPGNWWQDEQGRDALYAGQGAYVEPTAKAEGAYGDPMQFNPMQAAHPLVSFSGPTGERVLDKASRQMMTGTEGFRAYMDAQDMGGFSIPVPGQKPSHNNAFSLSLPGEPSREDLAGLIGAGKQQGMGDVVHSGGPNASLTEFYPGKTGIGAKEAKEMNAALGDKATAAPTRLESGGVFYEDAWRGGADKGAPAKQGSDMATNQMLGELNAAQEAALDTPAIRAKAMERFDRDAKVAAERGDVVREDIQRARKLFAEGGFKALRDNLKQGLLPAAAAGLFLNQQRGGSSDEGT